MIDRSAWVETWYAQDRMSELLNLGFTRSDRMGVISQELGHFRPDIVSEYLY